MTANIIDRDRAIDLLNQAVAARGEDWTYPPAGGDCWYTISNHNRTVDACLAAGYDASVTEASIINRPGEKGACVVGYIIMDLLGVDEGEVEVWETHGAFSLGPYVGGYRFTDDAANLLRITQERQDFGIPWGQAVRMAVEGLTYAQVQDN